MSSCFAVAIKGGKGALTRTSILAEISREPLQGYLLEKNFTQDYFSFLEHNCRQMDRN